MRKASPARLLRQTKFSAIIEPAWLIQRTGRT